MFLKKILFLLPFALFLFVPDVFAFTVFERSGSALTKDPYYDSANDRYVQEFNPSIVKRVEYGAYSDSSFTNRISFKAVDDNNFIGVHYMNCNTFYLAEYKDGSGNVVGTLKYEATQLVSPKCDSGADGGLGGSGSSDCSTAVCECIADLKGVNSQIKTAVESNGVTLNNIENKIQTTNTILNGMDTYLKDRLGAIYSHMSTEDEVDIDNIATPDVPSSDNRGSKPSQPTQPFTDNSTHFTDKGDAPMPDALPDVPEPEACWDKTGTCKESELTKDGEKTKDSELSRDSELIADKFQRDLFTQDDELKTDSYSQDAPLTRDNILNTDLFQRDSELAKDSFSQEPEMTTDNFSQDNQYSKTNQFSQTHQYTQQPVITTLPDWTN